MVADACTQYPIIIESRRQKSAKNVEELKEQLRAEVNFSSDPFWATVRYDLWPYFIVIGLSLKFGKAVTAFRGGERNSERRGGEIRADRAPCATGPSSRLHWAEALGVSVAIAALFFAIANAAKLLRRRQSRERDKR